MDSDRITEKDRLDKILDDAFHAMKVEIGGAIRAFQMEVLSSISAFDVEANLSLDRIELQQFNFKAAMAARLNSIDARLCEIERKLFGGGNQ